MFCEGNTHTHMHLDHMGRGVEFHVGETSDANRLCLKLLSHSNMNLLYGFYIPPLTVTYVFY